MKKLTFIFFLLFSIGTFAQDITDNVTAVLKTGNAKELANYFTASIDLAVEETDDVFSKAQAEQILKKFFEKNKPSTFEIIHSGKSKLGIEYRIGKLETANGTYRVTFNMKDMSGKNYIHQLRIEED